MKVKLLILFLILIGHFAEADATRPLRKFFPVRQSDGSVIDVCKQGNGRFVFYSTRCGIALVRGENGDLEYAKKASDGLSATGIMASESDNHFVLGKALRGADKISIVEKEHSTDILSTNEAYEWMSTQYAVRQCATRELETADGLVPYGTSAGGVVNSIGSPTIPVIMVSFPDRDFLPGTTPEKVGRMLNEKGYSDEKYCQGSVKDYFAAQSNGLFTPSYDVVAKVKMSKPYAYYGENYPTGAIDMHVVSLVKEALDSAIVAGVDFNKYKGKNGRIPLVSCYYAGPGEHSSFEKNSEDYIWAHFSKRSVTVGDVGVDSYFVGNETLQQYKQNESGNIVVTGTQLDGIGIFVHEFGHALGLPDFYSTNLGGNEDIETLHFWSVMDYGQYFYDGYAPIGYNAFERASLGWLNIQQLSEPQYAELFPLGKEEKGVTAYRIVNKANPKEYYILENRQPDTWYSKLLGHGMLITHVDYDQQCWRSNKVNIDNTHQRFEFVPADNMKKAVKENGRADWNGLKADLFPGTKQVTEFTDNSLPAANVYVGGKLEQPIYNIKECQGVISFSFMDKTLTGIEHLLGKQSNGDVEIFTLTGHKVVREKNLVPGIYVIKGNSGSQKLYVK